MSDARTRAYTLVEILIGIFVLSIGIVSILGAFPMGIRVVQKIKRTTMLCNYAVMKIAEYQAYANPRDTLCGGESVNPYVAMPADIMHAVGGIERSSEPGALTGSPNGVPEQGLNGSFAIQGAGKNLHWKIADFEYYIRNQPSLYQTEYEEEDYLNDSDLPVLAQSDYRIGLTQNNRRHEGGYGFVRKYIMEVWAGDEKTKTDRPDFNPNVHKLLAYYAFSTGIWNPHIFYTQEWSPVVETDEFQGNFFYMDTPHDYFWPWNNTLEGWGYYTFPQKKDINGDFGMFTAGGYPASAIGRNWPWGR